MMASTTTTTEHLSATNGTGVRLPSGVVVNGSGAVSTSSIDDEDEIYDDDGDDTGEDSRLQSAANASLYGGGSHGGSLAGKRRKQVRPIRFSAMQGAALIGEENDRPMLPNNAMATAKPTASVRPAAAAPMAAPTAAADVLDLSKAPTSSSNALPMVNSKANKQRAAVPPSPMTAPTGAAVLDLCVKGGSGPAQPTSLKPHDSNSIQQIDASRKRRLSGNGTPIATPNNQQQHQQQQQQKSASIESPVPVPCQLCHKPYVGKSNLQRHMRDVHGVGIAMNAQGHPKPKQPRSHARQNTATKQQNAAGTPNGQMNNNNGGNGNTQDTNAAAAALAQALFLPGSGQNGANQAAAAAAAAFNPALMLLSNPWANMLPPEGLAKLLQAYQLQTSNAHSNGGPGANNAASTASSSPPSSASPALMNGGSAAGVNDLSKAHHMNNNNNASEGRSNPTPPSTSSRSTPQPMSNAGSAGGMADNEQDGPANFSMAGNKGSAKARKMEPVDSMAGLKGPWDVSGGLTDSQAAMAALGSLPLFGGMGGLDEQMMMDQKPADSLLRSTVAARLADRVECDICHKQVCNKYFLKSHKLKIHGIQPTPNEAPPSNKKTSNNNSSLPLSLSPSLLPWNSNNNNSDGQNLSTSNNNNAEQSSQTQSMEEAEKLSASPAPSGLPMPLPMQLSDSFLASLPGMFRSPARNTPMVSAKEEASDLSAATEQAAIDASKNAANVFAASALLRPASPPPTTAAVAMMTPKTPKNSMVMPGEPMTSPSSMMPTDLSVRRPNSSVMRPFPQNPLAAPAYLPPNMMPGMPGSVPPPGWRPASTWRWKETSSISRVTCDICGKELCNKYFLRTHKQNRHGIKDETKSSTSGSQKSKAAGGADGTPALPGDQSKGDLMPGEWMSSMQSGDMNKSEADSLLRASLEPNAQKNDTARCRCSECGKRFFSPQVYRRHMGFCHGIPVLVGSEQQKQRSAAAFISKLKRQSRRRQQLHQKMLMGEGVWGEFQTDEVVFRVVSAVNNGSSNNDSGVENEAETAFDWPQQLCVFLKKRQQQTPSASSCSSGVGLENSAPLTSKSCSSLPQTVTLTLKLEERKPGLSPVMRPIYARIGDLVPLTSVDDCIRNEQGNSNMMGQMGEDGSSQGEGGQILSLLMPSTSASPGMLQQQSPMMNDEEVTPGNAPLGTNEDSSSVNALAEDDRESGVVYDGDEEPAAIGMIENTDEEEQQFVIQEEEEEEPLEEPSLEQEDDLNGEEDEEDGTGSRPDNDNQAVMDNQPMEEDVNTFAPVGVEQDQSGNNFE